MPFKKQDVIKYKKFPVMDTLKLNHTLHLSIRISKNIPFNHITLTPSESHETFSLIHLKKLFLKPHYEYIDSVEILIKLSL